MSRDKGDRPAGYAPRLRLSLREQSEGGPLGATVKAEWLDQNPIRQNEVLVLVHGFNNHQGEAEFAYQAFRDRQEPELEQSRRGAFEDGLGDFFWPGDAKGRGPIDWFDALVYPSAVGTAKVAGPRLRDYLLSRTGDVLVVHFIAHSLGCRLTLETIAALQAAGAPKVGKVCLMAAAVPTFKVCPGGPLFAALNAPEFLRVLFSPADTVLHWTFPPGQTLAQTLYGGDEGFFPTAVGRHGDIPLHPGVVDRQEVPGAHHSDYWGKEQNVPTALAAKALAEFFRFDGAAQRPLPARVLCSPATLPAREIAVARDIGEPAGPPPPFP